MTNKRIRESRELRKKYKTHLHKPSDFQINQQVAVLTSDGELVPCIVFSTTEKGVVLVGRDIHMLQFKPSRIFFIKEQNSYRLSAKPKAKRV